MRTLGSLYLGTIAALIVATVPTTAQAADDTTTTTTRATTSAVVIHTDAHLRDAACADKDTDRARVTLDNHRSNQPVNFELAIARRGADPVYRQVKVPAGESIRETVRVPSGRRVGIQVRALDVTRVNPDNGALGDVLLILDRTVTGDDCRWSATTGAVRHTDDTAPVRITNRTGKARRFVVSLDHAQGGSVEAFAVRVRAHDRRTIRVPISLEGTWTRVIAPNGATILDVTRMYV